MNSNGNDFPFKTTWAGQDARIHSKKPTWSVGNFNFIPTDQQTSNNQDNTITIQKLNHVETISPSHKWLMLNYLLKILGK